MAAVQKHPSLKSLNVNVMEDPRNRDLWMRLQQNDGVDITQSLGRVLRTNRKLTHAEYQRAFNRVLWEKQIAPALEYNQLEPEFAALVGVQPIEKRLKVVGKGLLKFSRRSWLVWKLVKDNQDIITDRIQRARLGTRNESPPPKRRRVGLKPK